jgi:hypothetical protein
MTTTENAVNFQFVVLQRLARLEKVGGKLIEQPVTNGQEFAAVGENQGVHFVMYPDDKVERFEKNQFVKYRSGWTGPVINDEESLRKQREEQARLALQAANDEKERKRTARKRAKADPNAQNSAELLKQRYDIKIPDNFVDTIDSVRPAFDFFFDKFGEAINRKIGSSVREAENWNDPEYVLQAVMDKMHDYLGVEDDIPSDGPECTHDDWVEFKELDEKYRLALAYQYCGQLPY